MMGNIISDVIDWFNQPWVDVISKFKYGSFEDPKVAPAPNAPQTREQLTATGAWTWNDLLLADQQSWNDWKATAIPAPDKTISWMPVAVLGIGLYLLLDRR